MDISGLFSSRAKYLADFARIQTILYRQDPALQDYFHPLQLDLLDSARARAGNEPRNKSFWTSALHGSLRFGTSAHRQRMKADVLVCPSQHFGRRSETLFFFKTVLGVAETGAKVLCLVPDGEPSIAELDLLLEKAGRKEQVEYFDVRAAENQIEARLAPRIAKKRAKATFDEVVQLLEPHGLTPGTEMIHHFEARARYVDAWDRVSQWVEFDTAIVRCHWLALGSSVCRTAAQRTKQAITFQQGVIGHTLDVPVTASKYVAFGDSSADFLARCNQRFFAAADVPEPAVEFVRGGCLFDTIVDLHGQFDQRTLLLVDVPAAQSDFYGIEEQCSGLLQLAERLLDADLALRRVVIRPHPFWSDLDFRECHRIIKKHPLRCELSHPSWSLDEDLRRSSIIAGIFSGVLSVAAASGLPAIFLQTKHGYSTGDLDCFSSGQILDPEESFKQISKAIVDRDAYGDLQTLSQRNARAYYAGGATMNFDAATVERLLKIETPAEAGPESKR